MLFSFGKKPCNNCEARGYCTGCPNDKCLCCQGFCVEGCHKCHVVCSKSSLKKPFLRDIKHSFDFNNIKQPKFSIPPFVPVVDEGMDLTLFKKELPFVAIRAKSFITGKGQISKKISSGLHTFYKLPHDTKIFVALSAKEFHLEEIWSKRQKLIKELKNFNIYSIIGPNLTVALDDPRYWNLINMKRNNIFSRELAEEGYNVIPDISWGRREDLLRLIEWFNTSNISTFSLTLQLIKTTKEYLFKQLLSDLMHLQDSVPSIPKMIFYGAGFFKALRIINSFPNVSFFESRPFLLAKAGRRYIFKNGRLRVYKDFPASKEKLFLQNLYEYKKSLHASNGIKLHNKPILEKAGK